MTKTYAQLVKDIEALQAAADKARQKEVQGVIERIREAIDVYGLTVEDLGFSGSAAATGGKAAKSAKGTKAGGKAAGGRAGRAAATPKAPKGEAVVKYRNDTGGTWGGRGKRPRWLQEALAGGKTLADFEVK